MNTDEHGFGGLKLRYLCASVFICGLLLSVPPCLRGELDATCRCGAGALELVFVVDATSSMGPVIGTIKAQAERMVEILESHIEKLRVGGVAYRTRVDKEMPLPAVLDLTADRKKLVQWLRGIRADGGGDEAVGDGVEAALGQMSWTTRARKVIVLIGDEGPTGALAEDRLVKLAGEAKSKGIVVNTITPSGTAWHYWFNLERNEDPANAVRVFNEYGDSKERLKRSFRIPIFREAARAGGGRAVGTADTREIVKWLLAFGLGNEGADDPPDVAPPPASEEDREGLEPAHGRTRIGRVRYGAPPSAERVSTRGEWNTPRSFAGLVRHLASVVRIDLDEEPDVVSLDGKELWRYPLLYLSGHGPVSFTPAERDGLRKYAKAGGLLWADNCCGKPAFERTLRSELAAVFPDEKMEKLKVSHPLFDVGHVITEVRFTTRHRKPPYRPAGPHVEALVVDGREAVLYTPHSLGSGWKTYEYGLPCLVHDDDALRLSENIVLFAFSR